MTYTYATYMVLVYTQQKQLQVQHTFHSQMDTHCKVSYC